MLDLGNDFQLVEQVARTLRPKVTIRYAHLSTKSLQEAANSVSARLEEAMKCKTREGGAQTALWNTHSRPLRSSCGSGMG